MDLAPQLIFGRVPLFVLDCAEWTVKAKTPQIGGVFFGKKAKNKSYRFVTRIEGIFVGVKRASADKNHMLQCSMVSISNRGAKADYEIHGNGGYG